MKAPGRGGGARKNIQNSKKTKKSIRRKTARTLLIKDYANSLTNTDKVMTSPYS